MLVAAEPGEALRTEGTPQILPAIMGTLRQEGAEGELVLEQNDGCRRFYWSQGDLIHLQSDVAGEQLGSYLLRQGILDFPTLNELLGSGESFRLGDKVVQWGLMNEQEREFHLMALQELIMIHAMEHTIIQATWNPGPIDRHLSTDLHFRLDHRFFIWNTFTTASNLKDLCDLLYEEDRWRWTAPPNLLHLLEDLPLDPQTAFALSFLGAEPVGYQTLMSITGLSEEDAARLIVTLWALGALTMTSGSAPKVQRLNPSPARAIPPVILPPLAPAPSPAPPITLQVPPPLPEPTPQPITLDFAEPKIELVEPSPSPQLVHEEPDVRDDGENSRLRAKRLYLKAKNLLLQERTVEAVRLLEQSVQFNPDTDAAYEPWLMLGKLRLANPAWSSRAIEALQAASRIRPNTGEPWALMGELYHRKGFKTNAIACFKRALELDPSVPIPIDVTYVNQDEPGPGPESGSGLMGLFRSFINRKD